MGVRNSKTSFGSLQNLSPSKNTTINSHHHNTNNNNNNVYGYQTGLSNTPGTQAPPNFNTYSNPKFQQNQSIAAIQQQPQAPRENKLPRSIDQHFKEPDINRLPRQKTSDELISAIEDVTKRMNDSNELKYEDQQQQQQQLSKKNPFQASSSSLNDPDISYLVREVERRAKKQRDLDIKIRLNEKKLSNKYSSLAEKNRKMAASHSNQPDADEAAELEEGYESEYDSKSLYNTDDRLKREALIREIARLEELESKKNLKIFEQEQKLALDSIRIESIPMVSVEKFKPHVDSSSNKHDTLYVPIDVKNKDKLTEKELDNVVTAIEKYERTHPTPTETKTRYFLNGKEIYSTLSDLKKSHPDDYKLSITSPLVPVTPMTGPESIVHVKQEKIKPRAPRIKEKEPSRVPKVVPDTHTDPAPQDCLQKAMDNPLYYKRSKSSGDFIGTYDPKRYKTDQQFYDEAIDNFIDNYNKEVERKLNSKNRIVYRSIDYGQNEHSTHEDHHAPSQPPAQSPPTSANYSNLTKHVNHDPNKYYSKLAEINNFLAQVEKSRKMDEVIYDNPKISFSTRSNVEHSTKDNELSLKKVDWGKAI